MCLESSALVNRGLREKRASTNAVPGGVVLLVELFLDVSSDILLNAVLAEGSGGDVNGVLLHLIAHVSILDYGSSHLTTHGC